MSSASEIWFHLIGGNVSQDGIAADLDAIGGAGFSGIYFFHEGGAKMGGAWPGMEGRQVRFLTPEWDALVKSVAEGCRARGLEFRLQNCPGWSMSGGPWIKPENAMRILVCGRAEVVSDGFSRLQARPSLKTVHTAEPQAVDESWRDPQEIATIAFPALPVTERIRSVTLPPPKALNNPWSYDPQATVEVRDAADRLIRKVEYPRGCWQDDVPFTLALPATPPSLSVRVTGPRKSYALPYVRFGTAPVLDNWQAEAGWIFRGLLPAGRRVPLETGDCVPSSAIRPVVVGETVLPAGRWTVLRFAHVNAGKKNEPAPPEATGWECDKLEPSSLDRHFDAYVGRLAMGPLKGLVKGVLVDSWECERPNWTARLPERWKDAHPDVDLILHLPALVGFAVDSGEATREFLRSWRAFVGREIEERYYRRLSERSQALGLDVQYETGFGDVLPGDPLRFWRFCDTPTCEFWSPHDEAAGHVMAHDYKPVRACVSAAHVYGKRRAAAEAFTSFRLTWNENFRMYRELADRYFAMGVNHLAFQAYTHNPQVGWKRPGTSYGCAIGAPFLRGQTWWPYMRDLVAYTSFCERELSRGVPVVDVLRYLGDDVGHRPHELEPFPEEWKYDYLNQDALMTRLAVRDGRFQFPDGFGASILWVPADVFLADATRCRLEELEKAGGRIVRGDVLALCRCLDDAAVPVRTDLPALRWYHRRAGGEDVFFLNATEPMARTRVFRTADGPVPYEVRLEKDESMFLYRRDGAWREHRFVTAPAAATARAIALKPFDRPLGYWKDVGTTPEDRAFSGTRTYRTSFAAAEPTNGVCRFVLDLGEVEAWATVRVNGQTAARLWCAPYRCDLTPFVRPGDNALEIDVTSTWYNRLVFDAGRPEAERETWTIAGPSATAPLAPSGFKGPVRLLCDQTSLR